MGAMDGQAPDTVPWGPLTSALVLNCSCDAMPFTGGLNSVDSEPAPFNLKYIYTGGTSKM